MIQYFKNLWQTYKDWKIEREFSPYCEVCESCGEEGCCSVEKSLLGHNCKYGEWYARDVYFNNILIDELLTYIKENVAFADEVVDAAYNKAFEMAKEKYDEKRN